MAVKLGLMQTRIRLTYWLPRLLSGSVRQKVIGEDGTAAGTWYGKSDRFWQLRRYVD